MPRYFTLQQAEEVLPEVARAIGGAISLKDEYERADAQWKTLSQRVAAAGGARVDRGEAMEIKTRRQQAGSALQRAVEEIHEFGCLVKDLDIGLIDFPTLLDGKEVYLCWKLGEENIQFWHGVQEGFRGRKPIDAGFLEQHRGEPSN